MNRAWEREIQMLPCIKQLLLGISWSCGRPMVPVFEYCFLTGGGWEGERGVACVVASEDGISILIRYTKFS